MQAELTMEGTPLMIPRKVYTKEYVEQNCTYWKSSNQVGLNGWAICIIRNKDEIPLIQAAVLDALNHPERFNANDNYGALCNLKEYIKRGNAEKLRSRYAMPVKLEYRNVQGINSIVDANHDDKIIIPLTAGEILDVIVDLNKNRDIEEIYYAYEFNHETMTIEYLEQFQEYYYKGELNKIVKFICSKSNELGGFVDYGFDIIRNRLTSHYLFDNRKEKNL